VTIFYKLVMIDFLLHDFDQVFTDSGQLQFRTPRCTYTISHFHS